MSDFKELDDTTFLQTVVKEMLARGMDPMSIVLEMNEDEEPDENGEVQVDVYILGFEDEEKEAAE